MNYENQEAVRRRIQTNGGGVSGCQRLSKSDRSRIGHYATDTNEFENVDNADALPDQIALLWEASSMPVRSMNIQKTFSRKEFKNAKQVEIDVRDLPRGTYYLHIKNSRRKDKEVDAIRILIQ